MTAGSPPGTVTVSTFRAGTRVLAGLGSLERTAAELDRLGDGPVALVADRGIAAPGGPLDGILDRAGLDGRVAVRLLIGENPAPAEVGALAATARDAGCGRVLAVGGGSALGAAKAVALLLTNDVPVLDLEGVDRAARPPVPTVAVPTTAGSGSEVSNALVLHDPGRVREVVIRGDGYEPRAAVLDGTVLRGLPEGPLVNAALDALSHALESLWARGAGLVTEVLAHDAGRRIVAALPVAVAGVRSGANRSGANDAVLQELLEASTEANLACGNSGLALVHALSSAPSVHLPHGMQNGILLPAVSSFNASVVAPGGRELIAALPALYAQIGFEARFPPGAVDPEAVLAASRDHPFRLNNRRATSDEDVRELLARSGA